MLSEFNCRLQLGVAYAKCSSSGTWRYLEMCLAQFEGPKTGVMYFEREGDDHAASRASHSTVIGG